MIDPISGLIWWLLVLQGSGPSASAPTVFPRYFKTEAACEEMYETLHKQMYIKHVCIPPEQPR